MKIAEISIKRPSMVVVLFTILTLGGILAYTSLGYELIPKFETNAITISTVYPGASPSEVENTVTKKIEDAVSSLENIKKLEAKSYESLSLVTIQLTNEADADYSLNDAQRKVNAILADLPEDVKPPSLVKFSLSDMPIMNLAATSNIDDIEFYDLLDKKISPSLSRVNGVAQINMTGGQEREIQVNLDMDKLKAYGIAIGQVQQAIQASNLDFPTGSIKTREQSVLVRLAGKFETVQELRELVLVSKNGYQVRLGELADIQDSQKDADKLARFNKSSTILIDVVRQSDANAVQVSEDIQKAIVKLHEDYKNIGLNIEIANDSTTYTLDAADAVIHDLLLAVVLVAFVMLFFLHSIRNSVIVMVSIPASLIATFIAMSALGYTLNLMSLLGLSLVVGILVDDAIVVLENIYRHMEMGKNRVRAAYEGSKEIGFTVTGITLVIVVVFLPIAVSTGLVSNIIKQFCVVVVISTMLSLLSSFTIIPWLSSRFGKLEKIEGKNLFGRIILGFERGLSKFTKWVGDLLLWCLGHKTRTMLTVIVLFFSSIALLVTGYIGGEFFPASDKGEFLVQIELPKDAAIEKTNILTQDIENYISEKPEVVDLITKVGVTSEGFAGTQTTTYKAEIKVSLIDKKLRADGDKVYAAKLKRDLQMKFPGPKFKTTTVSIMGTAEEAPIAMVVMAPELDTAMSYAKKALEVLNTISGTTETKLTVEDGTPEIKVSVDRDKMAALGLNLATVGTTMQTAFNGNTDSKFRSGEYEYDINIRLNDFDRGSIQNVNDIEFINAMGQPIKLSQFATVEESSGPSVLERRDKSPSVTVQSQSVGRPSSSIVTEFEAALDSLPKPAGISIAWAGQRENESEGFGTLGIALLAAIVLVYLVMVALYDNYLHPLVVLFSVPLSFIGALLALGLTNNTLNIFTILGVIMLIGLVCKNAILIVDFTNQRRSEGLSIKDALFEANHARLRPILMTTIAMVFGMLPIAIASGAGAEWKNGLAWVIIGGLISSLFLTLIVVPVVYVIFEQWFGKKDKGEKTISDLMVEDYVHKDVGYH
ncbi:efflux RND transporter permease subunit [Gynurincola endophyticus]|uniref:efflux RND transporter permease subunit n=1 Tax=Gynurincola endophyticus TaxID=2479004 RepID=UPI000F8F4784|nr:efflux RND transporter permease subunit [Gynurincola endophyticus]